MADWRFMLAEIPMILEASSSGRKTPTRAGGAFRAAAPDRWSRAADKSTAASCGLAVNRSARKPAVEIGTAIFHQPSDFDVGN